MRELGSTEWSNWECLSGEFFFAEIDALDHLKFIFGGNSFLHLGWNGSGKGVERDLGLQIRKSVPLPHTIFYIPNIEVLVFRLIQSIFS